MSVTLPHIKTAFVQRSKSESNVSIAPAFETKNQLDSILSPRAGISIFELSKCLQVFLQDFTKVLEKNPNDKEQIHNLFEKIIDIAKILQLKSFGKGMMIDHIDTSVGMGKTA